MRSLRNRASGDDGAALVFVVLVLVTLLAFAAIAVDTAALVQERRQLQNGADAAAMAVGERCAQQGSGCSFAVQATAQEIASQNADDNYAAVDPGVDGVCGTWIQPCPNPPSLPTGGKGYVRVTTHTSTADGGTKVPFNFARVIGQDGQGVRRSATVVWGGVKAISTFPLAVAECEWEDATDEGTRYPPRAPGDGYWPYTYEQTILFHGNNWDDWNDWACWNFEGPPSGWRLPGGFGWLEPTSSCSIATAVDSWAPSKPGNSVPSGCRDALRALPGTVIALPVYKNRDGGGSGGRFLIRGYAAFYVTGYKFPGEFELSPSGQSCRNSETCITGFFLKDQVVSGGAVGANSLGALTVQYWQ